MTPATRTANNSSRTTTGLILLLTAVYTASYLCRYSYATVLPELVSTTGHSKTELSVAVTCLFVCYGIGQLISGFLGDRLPPKRLILGGMLLSCALNAALPFINSIWAVRVIWCLNGLAQAFFWPPIVGIMSTLFTGPDYARASVWVSYGGYAGTIMLYLISPVLISFWSWRATFIFSSVAGIIIAAVFALKFPDIAPARQGSKRRPDTPPEEATQSGQVGDNAEATQASESVEPMQAVDNAELPEVNDTAEPPRKTQTAFIKIISPTLLLIMLAIIIQGFIKDGVTTWMPTYISELFSLDSGASILTGIVLPIFSIISLKLTNLLNRRKLSNPLLCGAVLFGAGSVAALILFAVGGRAAVFTVLFSALLTGSMHGVNLMLICMIPPYFKSTGNVSAVSGLLNFTTYVGSSVSAYVLAAMSESLSWNHIFLILALLAVFGGTLCFLVRGFKVKSNN